MANVTLAPVTGALAVTLTRAERVQLGALADRLVGTEPKLVDDPVWLDAARRLCCQVPARLQEAIRCYRHDAGIDGLLVVRNLPIDSSILSATPTVSESVERTATPSAAATVLAALCLGEIVAYRQEKAGALVQNVVPVPGWEKSQSNAGSAPLELHVENAFHPYRPDFVCLLCLRNDQADTAGLLVSSVRRALRLVPGNIRSVLHEPHFVTGLPPSFRARSDEVHADEGGTEVVTHAVLDGDRDDPNIRLDFAATRALDDDAKLALEKMRNALVKVSRTVVLHAGEMAFVDNRIAIHGRTAFAPRYDGNDRWLHRAFVHLDYRRSRALRIGNSPVLS